MELPTKKEEDGDESSNETEDVEDKMASTSPIDVGLSKFAERMPIFEPARIESSSTEKPLTVNLDLALYRAKVLARNYRYENAEKILQKVSK